MNDATIGELTPDRLAFLAPVLWVLFQVEDKGKTLASEENYRQYRRAASEEMEAWFALAGKVKRETSSEDVRRLNSQVQVLLKVADALMRMHPEGLKAQDGEVYSWREWILCDDRYRHFDRIRNWQYKQTAKAKAAKAAYDKKRNEEARRAPDYEAKKAAKRAYAARWYAKKKETT